MSKKVGSSLDLTQNELQNATIQNLGSAPSSPKEGQLYYNTASHGLFVWNGAWRPLDAALLSDASIPFSALASTPVIANGAITGATKTKITYDSKGLVTAGADATTADINDSTNRRYLTDAQLTVVQNTSGTNTGDSASIPAGYLDTDTTLAANSDAKVASQRAIKAYVDAIAQGVLPKNAVDWVTGAALPSCTYSNGSSGVGATLTASSNGALTGVDGGSPVVGQRILVKDQVTGLQNGIYVMTQLGDGTHPWILTRSTDCDLASEIKGAWVYCLPGGTNNANQNFTNTNSSAITIGTTAITFTQSSGVADITAGTGLSKSGNSLSIDTSVTVDKTTAQTLTNKTLTSPVINSPTGIVKGDVGLGNVDNTSDATKNAAVATLTNKTLTSPVINTPTGIVKSDVGLGNVDNTSDATKNAASATLTNKTINGANNTISGITEAMLSLSNNTTGDVSITKHGFAPIAPNDTSKFLRGDATWAAVPGGLTKFSAVITGNGSATAFTVADNLGTLVKIVQIYDASGNEVIVDNQRSDTNHTVITFGIAPANSVTYTVVCIG